MIRWGFVLGAVLFPCAAHSQVDTKKAELAFVAICSAAIDEKPDISAVATSAEMVAPGGLVDAITIGRTGMRVYTSPQTKQYVTVTINTYSDAREINCQSILAAPTARSELQSLAQSLKLEGDLVEVAGALFGRWKRPANRPLVFVSMLSTAASTTLNMQRIDFIASDREKK